jgi:hypothetical protein
MAFLGNKQMVFKSSKPSPYREGLVAYYNLNANALDFSSKGNHGVVSNNSNFQSGIISNGLNTTSAYLDTPNNNDFNFYENGVEVPFAIMFWVKFTNANDNVSFFFLNEII